MNGKVCIGCETYNRTKQGKHRSPGFRRVNASRNWATIVLISYVQLLFTGMFKCGNQ